MENTDPRVPEELLQQLHKANEHFHASGERLKAAMESTDFAHHEGLTAAGDELRKAEGEVETADAKIKEKLAVLDEKPDA